MFRVPQKRAPAENDDPIWGLPKKGFRKKWFPVGFLVSPPGKMNKSAIFDILFPGNQHCRATWHPAACFFDGTGFGRLFPKGSQRQISTIPFWVSYFEARNRQALLPLKRGPWQVVNPSVLMMEPRTNYSFETRLCRLCKSGYGFGTQM